MYTASFYDAAGALPHLCEAVLGGGEIGSRVGRVKEIRHVQIELKEPWKREIIHPLRRASLPAQIAETIWVLSGRNDIEWLSHYLPRAADFSDDGVTWRAGYGPRLRGREGVDPLLEVVRLLREDRATRRAVISLWDPAEDYADSKDVPCNNWLHFLSRDGKLDLHVATRSNDLIWGWSGINAFEWSALLEIVAGLVGADVGSVVYSISSLHIYDRHWGKAEAIAEASLWKWTEPEESPRFVAPTSIAGVDLLLRRWLLLEEKLRARADVADEVFDFPEPMLRSWLCAIGWWWTSEQRYLDELGNTRLKEALLLSPATVRKVPAEDARKAPSFEQWAGDLHAEKHAAYGDSWKKRGELFSILPNIARKVDRLGATDDHETALDTATDLLIYLIKYRRWIHNYAYEVDEVAHVREVLADLDEGSTRPSGDWKGTIRSLFEELLAAAEKGDARRRADLVGTLLQLAHNEARNEWWKAGNAKRAWKGYEA